MRGLAASDKATLVLFGKNAEENMRATADRARLDAAIDAAKVTSGATRYGPALKLAESILSRSPLKRREAVLISDFQKSGWSGSEDVRFPDGMTLTTVSVADAEHGESGGAVGDVRARRRSPARSASPSPPGSRNKGDAALNRRAGHARRSTATRSRPSR